MKEIIESTSESCRSIHCPLIEQQRKNTEVQLGLYSLKSHGAEVVGTHMRDWLVLVLLVVIKVALHFVPPFYRFVGKDMMTDLKYPMKSNTVPTWAVQVFSTLFPVAIFLVFYIRRRDIYDLHHATLGLLFSILLTSVVTDTIKDAVGRPRPDFFWRCFPNGEDVYDHLGNVACHGNKSVAREGYKSFPSGHTSCNPYSTLLCPRALQKTILILGIRFTSSGAFAGMGFLSLYLSGKIKLFDQRGHVAKLCIVVLPLVASCLVGISRVDDYWDHWQDVFAGACLGLLVAAFFYLQLFPPPHNPQGCRPYAYFQALEVSRASLNSENAMDPVDTEASTGSVTTDASNTRSRVHVSSFSSGFVVDDVECGRRGEHK